MPTPVERLLWRLSVVISGMVPILIFLTLLVVMFCIYLLLAVFIYMAGPDEGAHILGALIRKEIQGPAASRLYNMIENNLLLRIGVSGFALMIICMYEHV